MVGAGGGQCLDFYDVFEDFRHTILVFFFFILLCCFHFLRMTSSFVGRFLFVCFLEYFLCVLWSYFIFLVNSPQVGFPPPSFLSVFQYSLSLFSGSAFCLLLVPSGPQFWNRAYTGGLSSVPQGSMRCRCWARLGLGQVHSCTMSSVLSYFSLRWWTSACYDFSQPLLLGRGTPLLPPFCSASLGFVPCHLWCTFCLTPSTTELLSIHLLSLSGTQ